MPYSEPLEVLPTSDGISFTFRGENKEGKPQSVRVKVTRARAQLFIAQAMNALYGSDSVEPPSIDGVQL